MACETIQIRLDKIELRCPREWGTCWLGLYLWDMLELDTFWKQRLPSSRKGTSWLNILKALTCYRLIDPGSEFRFHREWYLRSAMGDLLGKIIHWRRKTSRIVVWICCSSIAMSCFSI